MPDYDPDRCQYYEADRSGLCQCQLAKGHSGKIAHILERVDGASGTHSRDQMLAEMGLTAEEGAAITPSSR